MADSLGNVVNAIRDTPTRVSILGLDLRLKKLDKTVSTVVRNNEQVVSYALSSVNLTAGNGLTGGGDLSSDRSFAVGGGFGLTVSADAVAVDQTMVPTWTGIHTYSAQDVHNAGVSLGTSGVLASAEEDSGGQAGFALNLTRTRSTDDVYELKNTADSVRFMQCSANGEWGFGRQPTANTLWQTGWVLGFSTTTTYVPTNFGGVLGAVTHNNSAVTPTTMKGLRGSMAVAYTSGSGEWAGVESVISSTQDSASFSTRELAAFRGGIGIAALTTFSNDYSPGSNIAGDWKRVGTYRSVYWHAAGTVAQRPKISYGACLSIPGYSATAANSGEQHGLEILADTTGPTTTPLTSAAATIPFPARGTNKAHLAFIATAAAAGGPTWGPSSVSGSSITTGQGGWYVDVGTSNPNGPAFHDGTAWRYVLHPTANANGAAGAAQYGSITGLWQFDHMQQVTFDDAKNVIVGSVTGTKIGTATTQMLGFFNKTPIVQPANTVAINDVLVNLGFRASGGVSNFTTNVDVSAVNIVTDTVTGTKIGTATSQKLSFWNVAPTAQPGPFTQTYSTASHTHANLTAATLTDNSGGTANTTVQALTDPADTPASADALRDDLVANLIPELRNNFADLAAQVNALLADVTNAKQVLNAVIDDGQLSGIWS